MLTRCFPLVPSSLHTPAFRQVTGLTLRRYYRPEDIDQDRAYKAPSFYSVGGPHPWPAHPWPACGPCLAVRALLWR